MTASRARASYARDRAPSGRGPGACLRHAVLANDGSSRFLGQAPRQTTPEVALMKSHSQMDASGRVAAVLAWSQHLAGKLKRGTRGTPDHRAPQTQVSVEP